MFIMALVLALKNRGKVQSAVYNRSRNLLIVATLLMGTHFLIQFVGHMREQSPTLCWCVNIAFCVAVTPLYNLAELNLLRAGHNMKRRYWNSIIFVLLCYVCLTIGYFTGTLINDAQPYMTLTFIVAILYFLNLIELSWVLHKEMKVADTRLTDEELSERHNALRYTAVVMNWIILFSLLTPWINMSPSLLLNSVFGMIMFALLFWFLVKFIHYGENMAEFIEVNDEITEATMNEAEAVESDDSLMKDLQQRIELWVSQKHYTNPNITMTEALEEMGITAKMLNLYLLQYTSVDSYRAWLPMLRIKEAKRVMLAHPEYCLQAIAEACGYTRSGNFSRAFKAQEGISPSEWMKKQA